MAISKCISLSTENRIETTYSNTALHVNETGYHGSPEFPIAAYLDDVSKKYVNWHWHEEFEIGFVTEGSILLGCGNRQYKLDCGDIFFVNSNVLHSMRNSTHSGKAVFKSMAFHGSIISEKTTSIFYIKYLLPILSSRNFREYVITKVNRYNPSIRDMLIEIWNLMSSEPADYEIQVRTELSNIFCVLNKLQKKIEETHPLQMPNYLLEKRVQVLLDYIHTHYNDKITIEELARTASISKTEVLRSFKIIVGMSPINYLNSYRLQRAAHMLIDTNKSIQEIAEDCGFNDNSYFSKLFKKKYSITPHDYRLPQ